MTEGAKKRKDPSAPRSVAVVSGKGGSGKTMITAVIARVLDEAGYDTFIVDGDTGTAGMTYYLSVELVRQTRFGLSDVALETESSKESLVLEALRPIAGFQRTAFFGIGDHSLLYAEVPEDRLPKILKQVVVELSETSRWVVIDCRGGIDRESIAVCEEVDDILIIAEPDTTSFQATKHVINVLTKNRLKSKIRGFLFNKVFDDPSVISREGKNFFGVPYLGSIPLDLKAARDFLVGQVPSLDSLLGIHVWHAVFKSDVFGISPPRGRPWNPEEFREVGLSNLDSMRGGIAIAGLLMTLGITFIIREFAQPVSERFHSTRLMLQLLAGALLLGLAGSIETTRRLVGRIVDSYARLLKRMLSSDR